MRIVVGFLVSCVLGAASFMLMPDGIYWHELAAYLLAGTAGIVLWEALGEA